jgi:hypothetical protein
MRMGMPQAGFRNCEEQGKERGQIFGRGVLTILQHECAMRSQMKSRDDVGILEQQGKAA